MKLFPKFGWRITKYNPAFRNENGAYLNDEWISISDVGKIFDGEILTLPEYRKAEDAYVSTALRFFSESGIESLEISYVEKKNLDKLGRQLIGDISYDPKFIRKGIPISSEVLESVCRLVLREVVWCVLESEANFYIHFGYDYYMYIGSNSQSVKAIKYARESGLFVEPMMSPYLNVGEE